MEKFIITSYYTIDTPYVDVCQKYLMPSLKLLGLEGDIRGVTNLGSWQSNTAYKPQFILEMLDAHQENIVFLDADAEVLMYPKMFESIPEEYDLALHMLDKNEWYKGEYGDFRYELLSGTLWVRNNLRSRRIVNEWLDACRIFKIWEQKVFQSVVEKNKLKIYQLPLEYCYIKSLPDGSNPHIRCEHPVIVHNQVSRSLKRGIHN